MIDMLPKPIETSHELAAELMKHPDMPLTIVCMGHNYDADHDRSSHGPIKIGIWQTNYSKSPKHLFVGEILSDHINGVPIEEWLFKPEYVRI